MENYTKIYRNKEGGYKVIETTLLDIEELAQSFVSTFQRLKQGEQQQRQLNDQISALSDMVKKLGSALKKTKNHEKKKLHKAHPDLFAQLGMVIDGFELSENEEEEDEEEEIDA